MEDDVTNTKVSNLMSNTPNHETLKMINKGGEHKNFRSAII